MNTKTIKDIKEQVSFILAEYHEKGGRLFYNDIEINEAIECAFWYGERSASHADIDVYKEEDTITLEFKQDFAVLIIEYSEKWKQIDVKLTGEYTFNASKNKNGEYFDGMILE